MCVAKSASGEINLYIIFCFYCLTDHFHIHTILLMAYIDTICELSMHITFYFFFLSRWILERVELEAGPEHPRIKIVPEDWFLWISKNEDKKQNLNGILWFFSWRRKHCLNTGIYSYLLCNSIQHCLQKVLHRTPTFWLSESVCIRDKQCSKEKNIGCYVQGKWSLRNELENSILINSLNKQ